MHSKSENTFFRTKSCTGCMQQPCERLRYGSPLADTIILVHNSRMVHTWMNCPLALKELGDIESTLASLSIRELETQLQSILLDSAIDEQLHCLFSCSLTSFSATTGRRAVLLDLWKKHMFSVLKAPSSLANNQDLFQGFYGYQGLILGKKKMEEEDAQTTEEECPGNPGITNLLWKMDGGAISKAHVGDEVELTADVQDIDDGTGVRIDIFEKDDIGSDDFILSRSTVVKNGKVNTKWKVEYHEDEDDTESEEELKEKGYTLPEYVFKIICGNYGVSSGESGVLEAKGWIDGVLVDDSTKQPLANKEYIIFLPDGSTKKGKTDSRGLINEHDMAAGKYYLITL